MSASTSSSKSALLSIQSGRSIAFSPEWRGDGLSVLFDRNSGDYWVVSSFARHVVGTVVQGQVEMRTAIEAADAAADGNDEDMTPEVAARVLDELVQLGIVAAIPADSSTYPGHSD